MGHSARRPAAIRRVALYSSATALVHCMAIVTHNVIDFEGTGLQIIDP
jgi:predicted nucleic acid-binding protein